MAGGNRYDRFVTPKNDRAVQRPFCARIIVVYLGLQTSHMISLVSHRNKEIIRFVDMHSSLT